jgi:hypothetical protein
MIDIARFSQLIHNFKTFFKFFNWFDSILEENHISEQLKSLVKVFFKIIYCSLKYAFTLLTYFFNGLHAFFVILSEILVNLFAYTDRDCEQIAYFSKAFLFLKIILNYNKYYEKHFVDTNEKSEIPRPQTGSTAILKEWLRQNKFFPYPTSEQKLELSKQTNMTQQQINNWFKYSRKKLNANDLKLIANLNPEQKSKLEMFNQELTYKDIILISDSTGINIENTTAWYRNKIFVKRSKT